MKDKEVENLLANLSLSNSNNLDKEDVEEEEEVIQSVEVKDDKGNEEDEYTSKGPVFRGNLHQSRQNPYNMPTKKRGDQSNEVAARFIDNETEIEFIMSRIEQPLNIPSSEAPEESLNCGIPDLPKLMDGKKESFRPQILIQNADADYQILEVSLTIVLDLGLKKIGIWIPETALEDGMIVDRASMTTELYIQLNGYGKKRLVNYMASIKSNNDGKLSLTRQFVHMAPIIHAGSSSCSSTSTMVEDIAQSELQEAMRMINSKNITDLLKSYGPTKESILMTFCCQKNDSPLLRAQIFAFISRILDEANEEAVAMIIQKNEDGLTALDYATMANNARIAAFLAKIFYIFGQDVLGTDSQGNTILHMMARKGDMVAPTLDMLLSLHYRDHNDNKRVYATDVMNAKLQMPIHIVAMNKKCAQHVVQLLAKDLPVCLRSPMADGSLPIHLACQFSSDPTLLATLLYYDKSVVNMEREDGFTPLHLVAARTDVHDVRHGIIRLDEETQVRMIRILLDHGADKTATVEDMYHPVDLLNTDRVKAKEYLKLTRTARKSCGSSGSSNNGSPTPPPAMSVMAPSPAESSLCNDLNSGGCYSPAASTASYQNELYSPVNIYSYRSVNSNAGSDADSDSDNCSPLKMGEELEAQLNSAEPCDYDYIAKMLIHDPTIQSVMENIL